MPPVLFLEGCNRLVESSEALAASARAARETTPFVLAAGIGVIVFRQRRALELFDALAPTCSTSFPPERDAEKIITGLSSAPMPLLASVCRASGSGRKGRS